MKIIDAAADKGKSEKRFYQSFSPSKSSSMYARKIYGLKIKSHRGYNIYGEPMVRATSYRRCNIYVTKFIFIHAKICGCKTLYAHILSIVCTDNIRFL